MRIAIALMLALLSTVLTNLAYMREQQAAAALPPLSVRRPRRSLRLLLNNRKWMLGFAMEGSGFACYATALALAPLALVQSVAAGGIGLLAYLTHRVMRQPIQTRTGIGVALSVLGLVAVSASLANGNASGHAGSILLVFIWLGGTAAAAAIVLLAGRGRLDKAVASGIAGGLCFSIGDISTKLATEWGSRGAFLVTVLIGYFAGTTLLQLGYQAGGALTVAGLATLLTNMLPIAAGTVVLEEPLPSGAMGGARVLAFFAVCAGGFLLAQPSRGSVPRKQGDRGSSQREGDEREARAKSKLRR